MPSLSQTRIVSVAVACASLPKHLLADTSADPTLVAANSLIPASNGTLNSSDSTVDGNITWGHDLCSKGIGAELWWPSVFQHLKGPRPALYDYTIPVALIGTFLVSVILAPHLSRLKLREFSAEERRTYAACGVEISGEVSKKSRRRSSQMQAVAGVPLVISILKLYPVLVPRSWKVLYFLASCYEAHIFRTFRVLLMELVADNPMDAQEVFAEAPPTKMWAVVPLACCFKRCMVAHQTHWLDLLAIQVLMWQFMFAIPAIAFLEMTQDLPGWADRALEKLESCSLVLAVYSLFALMAAAHDVLPEGRLHSKFWMMKGLFISNTVAFRAAKLVQSEDLQLGALCYPRETLASAVAGAVLISLAVPGAFLARYAFPVTDLEIKPKTAFSNQMLTQPSAGPLASYVMLPF